MGPHEHLDTLRFTLIVRFNDPIMQDHTVHGIHLMPGVSFLDMVYRILLSKGFDAASFELRNILFKAAIAATPEHDKKIRFCVEKINDAWSIMAKSVKWNDQQGVLGDWEENFQAELHFNDHFAEKTIDLAAIKEKASDVAAMEEAYANARAIDIVHGPFMQGLGQVYRNDQSLLAELRLGESAQSFLDYFYLHPAYLDAATVVTSAFGMVLPEKKPFIPIYIESFRANARLGEVCYVHLNPNDHAVSSKEIVYVDIELFNEAGQRIALFDKLGVKRIRSEDLIHKLARLEGNDTTAITPPPSEPDVLPHEASSVAREAVPSNPSTRIEQELRAMVAAQKKVPITAVSLVDGYYDQGLESTDLLKLVQQLEARLGQNLYPTLLFEYTNIRELAGFLAEEYGDAFLASPSLSTAANKANKSSDLPSPVTSQVPNQANPKIIDKDSDSQEPSSGHEPSKTNTSSDLHSPVTSQVDENTAQIEQLYFRPVWQDATPEDTASVANCDGGFLLFDDRREIFDALKSRLATDGFGQQPLVLVQPGKKFAQLADDHFEIREKSPEDYSKLIDILIERQSLPRNLVYLWSKKRFRSSELVVNAHLSKSARSLLFLAQTLLASKEKAIFRCLYVYPKHGQTHHPIFAAIESLFKTIRLENPKFQGKILALEHQDSKDIWPENLLDLILLESSRDDGTAVAYTKDRRQIRRLIETPEIAMEPAAALREKGVYLITGGTGGLGFIFAEYLAKTYRASLVLVGRSPLCESTAKKLEVIRGLGSDILFHQADVTQREDVVDMIEKVKATYGAIHGIIHAAGVLRDGFVPQKTATDLDTVFGPKIFGTLLLDEASKREPLDFFCLFSSFASALGNPGQSDYAYANGFMDHFAEQRNYLCQRGRRQGQTIAINWPIWAEGGMSLDQAAKDRLFKSTGIQPLQNAGGIAAFEHAIAQNHSQLVVVQGLRQRILPILTPEGTSPKPRSDKARSKKPPHPVIAATPASKNSPCSKEEIAIIGMSGRYPKAGNLAQFWENLVQGNDCISEVPADRWDYSDYPQSGTHQRGPKFNKWGGFIEDFDKFDPLFFKITPLTAEIMDPQERLFLETVWHLLEDAGYRKSQLVNQPIGVFAGAMWSEYQLFGLEEGVTKPSASFASIANRVSYMFNFKGPSMAIDTMCSSSLTAIHLACDSLTKGECQMAIAGGVNLSLHPNKYNFLAQNQMNASDGRCKSFGEGGDGYVPGEGVGAILLKPLSQAVADRDLIYAVIKSSRLNHGGKTGGYTVPSPVAQAQLIKATLEKAGVHPKTIGYLETHGTGTALGDPIEIAGLRKAFNEVDIPPQSIAIGSVKSNIGHLESAAGIAGITKLLLQMKHRKLVPSLHAKPLNPQIPFEQSPFYVQEELTEWHPFSEEVDGQTVVYPRCAGISSFGAGGSNAHILLEEWTPRETITPPDANPSRIISLSAKSMARLIIYATNIRDFLQQTTGTTDCAQEKLSEPADIPKLKQTLSEFIHLEADDIDVDEDFLDLGCDRNTLSQWAEHLTMHHGQSIQVADFTIYSSIRRLSEHIAKARPQVGGHEAIRPNHGDTYDSKINLANLAFTLHMGRELMEARLAFVANHISEVIEKLTLFIEGDPKSKALYFNTLDAVNQETLASKPTVSTSKPLSDAQSHALCEAWVSGQTVDWSQLYPMPTPQRISLPGYPFDREAYWVESPRKPVVPQKPVIGAVNQFAALHPLIDVNQSTLQAQSFRKSLKPHEYFLKDHLVFQRKILPGAAYLEMAVAAGQLGSNLPVTQIKDVMWAQPIEVNGTPRDVDIQLFAESELVRFEITSENEHARAIHAKGNLVLGEYPRQVPPSRSKPSTIIARCNHQLVKQDLYHRFGQMGFEYGPSFQVTQALYYNDQEALAELQIPEPCKSDFAQYSLHPSLIDGALRAVLGIGFGLQETEPKLRVPFSIGKIEWFKPLPTTCFAHARLAQPLGDSMNAKFDINLVDQQGETLAHIQDFNARTLHADPPSSLEKTNPPLMASPAQNTLYFEPHWQPYELKQPSPNSEEAGAILVFDDRGHAFEALNSVAEGYGNPCVVRVQSANDFCEVGPNHFKLHPGTDQHFQTLFQTLHDRGTSPKQILYLNNFNAPTADRLFTEVRSGFESDFRICLENGLLTMFHLVRGLTACGLEHRTRCLYVYQGEPTSSQPQHTIVAGFARSLTPINHRFELVNLQYAMADQSWSQLAKTALKLLASPGRLNGKEFRFEKGACHIRQIRSLALPPAESSTLLKNQGIYLLTGGMGNIGRIMAMHLAKTYKARLILTGRSSLDPQKSQFLETLKAQGGDAIYAQANVAVFDEVCAAVKAGLDQFGSLDGVFNIAGLVVEEAVTAVAPRTFEKPLDPKIYGTIYLDWATRAHALDCFVGFSSISSEIGDFGSCNYSAANRFLDAYIAHREKLRASGKRHGHSITLNWPLWADGAMEVPEEESALFFEYSGMQALASDEATAIFESAMCSDRHQWILAAGDSKKIQRVFGIESIQPNRAEAAVPTITTGETAQVDDKSLEKAAIQHLKTLLSKVTKLPIFKINERATLEAYGIDSVMIMEMNSRLEKDFGSLPGTLFFEYTNLRDLGAYFAQNHSEKLRNLLNMPTTMVSGNSQAPGMASSRPLQPLSTQPPATRKSSDRSDADIAVIGIHGRYPKAEDLTTFWDHLVTGKDCIEDVPKSHWDVDQYYDPEPKKAGKTYCRQGGFLKGVDQFDPMFFNIPPINAKVMDPQERLFLETAWTTIEDAGYSRQSLCNPITGQREVGVFVGVMWHDYGTIGAEEIFKGNPILADAASSSIANRVSYFFDFRGPSLAIDTACSSSLMAIHMACESLKRGECKYALAGGVNLSIHPSKYIKLSLMGMLAADGRCRSFGDGGQGYVPGEAVGAVLLKPLSQAKADGDRILGVIKGSAVNHGGRTNGYTVPNPNAQADLIQKAWENASVHPSTISYLEAHGTGTPLGDPIEITGLNKAFRAHTQAKQMCAIGSVKSNIGHCEGAAGISAFTKIILQLQNRKLVPSLHAQTVNPRIDFANSPFRLQQKAEPWQRPLVLENGVQVEVPRRAGISSFGAGGANIHLIVEEAPEMVATGTGSQEPSLITLSAKNPDRLHSYAQLLLSYLETLSTQPTKPRLCDIAFTLQTGREAMATRLAILAHSHDELIDKLSQFLRGDQHIPQTFLGQAEGKDPFLMIDEQDSEERDRHQTMMRQDQWAQIGKLWAEGAFVDWDYPRHFTPKRVALPTYPFSRQSYWVSMKPETRHQLGPVRQASVQLHPMIDRNISHYGALRFEKRFSPSAFYLKDHRVLDQTVLPGTAYLEMVRAAASLAGAKPVTRISDVFWARPMIFDGEPKTIHIQLKPMTQGVAFEVIDSQTGQKTVFAQGRISHDDPGQPQSFSLVDIQQRCSQTKKKPALYSQFKQLGFDYGESFQVTDALWMGPDEALARLNSSTGNAEEFETLQLHPAIMDGALRTAMGITGHSEQDGLHLPFALGALEIFGQLPQTCYAYARPAKLAAHQKKDIKKFHISLLDEHGNELVRIHDFAARPILTLPKPSQATSCYRSEWIQSEHEAIETKPKMAGTTWVFDMQADSHSPWLEAARTALKDLPDSHFIVKGPGFGGGQPSQINPDILEDYQALFEDANKRSCLPQNMIYLWDPTQVPEDTATTTAGLDQAQSLGQWPIFRILKAWSRQCPNQKTKLWLVHSTQPTAYGPLHEAIAGLANAVGTINHRFEIATVGLDQDSLAKEKLGTLLAGESVVGRKSKAVVFTEGERFVRRFNRCATQQPGAKPFAEIIQPGGTYLITGGGGDLTPVHPSADHPNPDCIQGTELAFVFAEYLASIAAVKLAIIGKSPLSQQKQKMIKDLEILGAEVAYFPFDLAETDQFPGLISDITQRFGVLNGVIHSSGLGAPPLLEAQAGAWTRPLLPRINATVALDLATSTEPLDFFIMFSSLTSELGDFGMGSYGAASRFLDSYAYHREKRVSENACSGRTLTINWPLWEHTLGAFPKQETDLYFSYSGMSPLQKKSALTTFEEIWTWPHPHVAVVSGHPSKMEKQLGVPKAEKPIAQTKTPPTASEKPAKQAPATSDALLQATETYLKQLFYKATEVPIAQIDMNAALENYGIDSIMIMELNSLLEKDFDTLPKTLFFELECLMDLAHYLVENHGAFLSDKFKLATPKPPSPAVETAPQATPTQASATALTDWSWADETPFDFDGTTQQPTAVEKVLPPTTTQHDDIAIIGLSGRYPQAKTLEAFWENLSQGRNCISEVPEARWDHEAWSQWRQNGDKPLLKYGGFIEDIDQFDPLFFNISPAEAETMDPQERLLLESVWESLEGAGYTRQSLTKTQSEGKGDVGIFVGCMYQHYGLLNHDDQLKPILAITPPSTLANRISYFFNFQGPSLTLDSACSASLNAIHLACESLRHGECGVAFASGVNLALHPFKYLGLDQMGILGSDGQSKSFGLGDGMIPGEGVGTVMLKPLQQAIADRDHIHGIIKASAVNHNGKTNGYGMPNPGVQSRLILRALERGGIDPKTLGYIETAANGSPMGDPIEVSGLNKVLKHHGLENHRIPIGSVKSNIGHLEAASGISQLTKVLLQFKHKKLAPSLHADPPNPNLDLGPLVIQNALEDWPQPEIGEGLTGDPCPRRAAVSSFGAGGTNAHLIVEEYIPQALPPTQASPEPQIVVVSAKNEASLRSAVQQLTHFLERESVNLADLAFTLAFGREAMPARLALVCQSIEALRDRLERFLVQDPGLDGVYAGEVESQTASPSFLMEGDMGDRIIQMLIAENAFDKLARLWVSGSALNWQQIFDAQNHSNPPKRLALPTYPFQRERYWLAAKPPHASAPAPGEAVHTAAEPAIITEPTSPAAVSSEQLIAKELQTRIAAGLKMVPTRLDLDTPLLDYGLDSFSGMRLLRGLEEHFLIKLPSSTLYDFPTINALAGHLAQVTMTAEAHPLPQADLLELPMRYPLSEGQKALWFIHEMNPNNNMPIIFNIRPQTQLDILERAFIWVMTRHHAFRTEFAKQDGVVYQLTRPHFDPDFVDKDFSHLSETAYRDALQSLVRDPFDLENDNLVRTFIIKAPSNKRQFLIVVHHIVFDGAGVPTLIQELDETYRSIAQHTRLSLPPVRATYADFVDWQENMLEGTEGEAHFEYWRQQFAGSLPSLQFPLDFPRPPFPTYAGDAVLVTLNRKILAKIKTIARHEKASLFMTLLAAFKVLLARYTGQRDLIVGSLFSGRPQTRFDMVMGYFVNVIAIRAQVDPNQSFRTFIQQIKAVVQQALDHGDFPFAILAKDMAGKTDKSRSPIYQAGFVLQNFAGEFGEAQPDAGGFIESAESEEFFTSVSQDLGEITLEIFESKEKTTAFFKYNTDLFARERIERFAHHYQVLLDEIAADVDQPINRFGMLSQEERKRLLQSFNDTQTDYPGEPLLHQLIEKQVLMTPDAPAIAFDKGGPGQTLTYRELNEKANQLAHYLRAEGVTTDTLVGICMERSLELVIGLLGILKAGGAYVPMDPAYPQDRLAYMLSDANVAILLCQAHLVEGLPDHGATILCLDSQWDHIAALPNANPTDPLEDHLAYMIYTSGSTGRPKGTMVTHAAIRNRLLWMQERYQLGPGKTVLQKTPFSFDVSVWEFFWPVMVGARMVLAKPEGHKDSGYLIELMASQQVSFMHFVPSMLNAFLQDPEVDACHPPKKVFCSGEALARNLQDRFFDVFPNSELHNLYGPTEAAVDVTFWACEKDHPAKSVPIGSPIANIQIHILDPHLNPTPIGVSGELHIAGIGLARGYLNRPGLTAEKFIPNPFANTPGARCYKTGDRTLYRDNGDIEYLERMDHQIKIRGFRVELGEIEASLNDHPLVSGSLVLARETQSGQKSLVAYVQTSIGDTAFLDAFEAQAVRHPNHLALIFENGDGTGPGRETLTYAALNHRANQLAHRLLRQGCAHGDKVGLWLSPSLELVVGFLAILKIGACVVPIDRKLSADACSNIAENTNLACLLLDSSKDEYSAHLVTPSVTLTPDWHSLLDESDQNPARTGVTNTAAWAIPNAIDAMPNSAVSYTALNQQVVAYARQYQLQVNDRVLQFFNGFPAESQSLCPTLMNGATAILLSEEKFTAIDTIREHAYLERATVLAVPPNNWPAWLSKSGILPKTLPPSLRLVIARDRPDPAKSRLGFWHRIFGAAGVALGEPPFEPTFQDHPTEF